MTAPPIAEEICARYLAAFDERFPDRLKGLYLVGSIALNDFQPGRSDIDFVAVSEQPFSRDDVASLHAELGAAPGRPFFDGIYATAGELCAKPAGSRGVAVIEGTVIANSPAERHAVTWLTLARHGIAVRGPAPSADWLRADPFEAREHARFNLAQYWQLWVAQHRRSLSADGPHGLTPDAVEWSVLGVARLHATIADGSLLSKSAAGHYAAERFPEYRAIIDYARAIRLGGAAAFPDGPLQCLNAMFVFLDAVIADALIGSCHPPPLRGGRRAWRA